MTLISSKNLVTQFGSLTFLTNCGMSHQKAVAILVSGLPGSGKTYFAKRFAKAIDAQYLSSDLLRKELIQERAYSIEEKTAVYSELLIRFGKSLKQGKTTLIDATFISKNQRDIFKKAAIESNAILKIIEIRANEATIKARLCEKREDSEADFSVFQKLSSLMEPITEKHLVLFSDENDVLKMIEAAKKWMEAINEH